jgi:hypothetical protein
MRTGLIVALTFTFAAGAAAADQQVCKPTAPKAKPCNCNDVPDLYSQLLAFQAAYNNSIKTKNDLLRRLEQLRSRAGGTSGPDAGAPRGTAGTGAGTQKATSNQKAAPGAVSGLDAGAPNGTAGTGTGAPEPVSNEQAAQDAVGLETVAPYGTIITDPECRIMRQVFDSAGNGTWEPFSLGGIEDDDLKCREMQDIMCLHEEMHRKLCKTKWFPDGEDKPSKTPYYMANNLLYRLAEASADIQAYKDGIKRLSQVIDNILEKCVTISSKCYKKCILIAKPPSDYLDATVAPAYIKCIGTCEDSKIEGSLDVTQDGINKISGDSSGYGSALQNSSDGGTLPKSSPDSTKGK